jgi:hypothetical protein
MIWCVQRACTPQGHPSTIRITRTPFRVRHSVKGARGTTIPRASRGTEAARGGGKSTRGEGRGRGTSAVYHDYPPLSFLGFWFLCHLHIRSTRTYGRRGFLSLEPTTPKGVGRCAEGSDDVGRAADIVLQRGTRIFHDIIPCPFPRVSTNKEKKKFPSLHELWSS